MEIPKAFCGIGAMVASYSCGSPSDTCYLWYLAVVDKVARKQQETADEEGGRKGERESSALAKRWKVFKEKTEYVEIQIFNNMRNASQYYCRYVFVSKHEGEKNHLGERRV